MDVYPLESLLSVRHFREEGAKRSVRYAEYAVREAEEEVIKRKEELEAFRKWRIEEEERRYDAIMNKPMSIRQIDVFKAGLAKLAAIVMRSALFLRSFSICSTHTASLPCSLMA